MSLPIKVSALVSVFRSEKYLAGFLENVVAQSAGQDLEIVFVHNDPTAREQELVRNFFKAHEDTVQYQYIVVPREPLPVSTNRAIRAARGEYVCVWNVDDLRTQDSIRAMTAALDQNPDASFTYGDFMIVKQWLSVEGKKVVTPEFDKRQFIQSMYLGPFYMWRKSVCNTLGFWDEQFTCAADFDFASRLSVEFAGVKTHGLLGYYLDEGSGLSTRRDSLVRVERTCIELRFGVYHKLDFLYILKARKYRLRQVLNRNKWVELAVLAPHIGDYSENATQVVRAFVTYPLRLFLRVYRYAVKRLQHI